VSEEIDEEGPRISNIHSTSFNNTLTNHLETEE
jgi:hypothetical protein